MKQPLAERPNGPYREAARRLYRQDGDNQLNISVGLNAAVQHVEDGAFVEAMLWVPNASLGKREA